MVAVVRDHSGQITGIQRTRLSLETNSKVSDAPAKISQGCIFGSSVLIQKGENAKVFLAEGIETALSLREAGVDGEIRAVLGKGNLLNIGLTVANGRHVVLVADNDGKPWEQDKPFVKVVNTLKESGYTVSVMFPEKSHHTDMVDFNDILNLEKGKSLIKRYEMELGFSNQPQIPCLEI